MAEENNGESGTPATVVEAKEVIANVQATEASAQEAIKEAQARADAVKAANPGTTKADSDMIAKLVQDRLEAELAGIKKSLDNAYKQRDESLAKVSAFEAKEKEAQLKRLAEEGKHKEAFEIQLAEERSRNDALMKRNTELSRDVNVREALRNLSFKNDKAAEMAFKEITANLVQDEHKQWVHRSGISVKEYCEVFSKDEDQSFLFKAKTNSGAGTAATSSGNSTPTTDNKPKSLFAMPQAEVLKMAAEGKFGAIPK